MNRVLHVVHYPVFGGPHNQALRLMQPLRERGWDTVVLLPTEKGNAVERLREGGVEVVQTDFHRVRATRSPRAHIGFAANLPLDVSAIRRVIREHSIALVQVAGLVNPHAAIAARLERVPVVWQILDTRAPAPVAGGAMVFVRYLADAVMATGATVALSQPGGHSISKRLFPYFPPVDTDAFRPRPESRDLVRREWGVPSTSQIVGCVANLNPQKGIVDLIRAFAGARTGFPDARLVVIGSEHASHRGYAQHLRERANGLGLVDGRDIIFAGAKTDVERHMAGFDVFAFTPARRGEGISTVVLEAMSVGLPVAVYDVAGLSAAVDEGRTGRLVAADDAASMTRVLRALLGDPVEGLRLGDAARAHAVATFGLAACADVHVAAYRFAINRRARLQR